MVFWVLGAGIVSYLIGYGLTIRYDWKRNRIVDEDPVWSTEGRILNDQQGATGMRFRYGLYRASWNGCEAIAVHNAKILLGIPSRLSGAMWEIQHLGGMFGLGFFGSDPFHVGWVMKRAGVKVRRVRLCQMDTPGVYILSYWNQGAPWRGAHTVAVRHDGTEYQQFNPYGSLVPEALGRRFICGYHLEVEG